MGDLTNLRNREVQTREKRGMGVVASRPTSFLLTVKASELLFIVFMF